MRVHEPVIGRIGGDVDILKACKPITGTPEMTSPYLDRPLLPLTVALPRMLTKIEKELPKAPPAEQQRLCRRAELVRGLLAASPHGPASRAWQRRANACRK
jgi:hypothetical protein